MKLKDVKDPHAQLKARIARVFNQFNLKPEYMNRVYNDILYDYEEETGDLNRLVKVHDIVQIIDASPYADDIGVADDDAADFSNDPTTEHEIALTIEQIRGRLEKEGGSAWDRPSRSIMQLQQKLRNLVGDEYDKVVASAVVPILKYLRKR